MFARKALYIDFSEMINHAKIKKLQFELKY